jgi:hypothetical protein
VDNPLSQERLDNKLWHLDVMLLKNATTDVYEEWLEVYSEIAYERKRLQAIEADYIALREIMDRARKIAFESAERVNNFTVKGVNDHE